MIPTRLHAGKPGWAAAAIVGLGLLGASCSTSDDDVPVPVSAQLLVRRASGGTMDVTATAWTSCHPGEPSPGMSRHTTFAFGGGTFTMTNTFFTASIDCTGVTSAALGESLTANTAASGDRVVGWDGTPPPSLATTVTASAVLLSGGAPPFDGLKALFFVNDGPATPELHFGGKSAFAPDGYPTTLEPTGRARTAP